MKVKQLRDELNAIEGAKLENLICFIGVGLDIQITDTGFSDGRLMLAPTGDRELFDYIQKRKHPWNPADGPTGAQVAQIVKEIIEPMTVAGKNEGIKDKLDSFIEGVLLAFDKQI